MIEDFKKIDVWSFGIMLFHLCTGRRISYYNSGKNELQWN